MLAPLTPTSARLKSVASTPVTGSVNVTVKSTLLPPVEAPEAREIELTVGSVASKVIENCVAGELLFPAASLALADGRALARAIRTRGQIDPVFVDDLRELPALLAAVLEPGDLVLMMGAGSIGRVAADLPRLLEGLDG